MAPGNSESAYIRNQNYYAVPIDSTPGFKLSNNQTVWQGCTRSEKKVSHAFVEFVGVFPTAHPKITGRNFEKF
jgi:hypothetical protein